MMSQYVPQNGIIHRSHMQQTENLWDFFKIQTANNVIYRLAENFAFNFRIYRIFSYLLSFANFNSTKFTSNRLNALSPYQKFV